MSDAPQAGSPEAAEKRPGLIARVRAIPGRITTPGWAAIATALFLLALVAAAWTLLILDPNIPWRETLSWTRILIVVALLVVIPVVLYYTVRLWLEGDRARFPDVDFAWNAGLRALARNGVSLRSTPLFLILGSHDPRHERAIVRATGLHLRVRGEPDGPAPLHWYANPQGIYLFLTEAGTLSELSQVMARREAEAAALGAAAPEAPLAAPAAAAGPPPAGSAVSPPAPPSAASAPSAAQQATRQSTSDSTRRSAALDDAAGRGTLALDDYLQQQQARQTGRAAGGPSRQRPVGGGTVKLDAPMAAAESAATRVSAGAAPEDQPALIAPQRAAEQLERLDYVCRLLRRARDPLCAANGVITLLPFQAIQAGAREARELEQAVKADLATVQSALQLRCPVTALVEGMEKERGFRELVKRVGPQRAAVQRFGRRYDVRGTATAEDLSALCEHVCGVFEDWIYTLFREKDALARPGNTQLYGLLCTVRSRLKGRLGEILSRGFGHDPRLHAGNEPILFSGCYFAATGETDDRQAFVKGVFDKLVEEQENVEWTARAGVLDRRYRWLAIGGGAAALLAAGVAAFLIVRQVA
jgi:hypothetical protein